MITTQYVLACDGSHTCKNRIVEDDTRGYIEPVERALESIAESEGWLTVKHASGCTEHFCPEHKDAG